MTRARAVQQRDPYAERITPTAHPEASRASLTVVHLGNTKLTASVSCSDIGDQLSYDIHPDNVQMEPAERRS